MVKKLYRSFFGLIMILISLESKSQNTITRKNSLIEDSLLNIISKEKCDTCKAARYNELALELRRNNPTKAIEYGNEALKIYTSYKHLAGAAKSYLCIGTGYLNLSNHPEAILFLKKSIAAGLKSGDKKVVARAYNNMGIVFIKEGNNPEALKNYFTGLKIRQELKDSAEMGSSFANIGNIYFKENNMKEALHNYETAVSLFEATTNKFGLANSLANIGNVYEELGNTDKALFYFNKALTINNIIKDKRGISSSYDHIGSVYLLLKKYAIAKDYFLKSKETELETQNYEGLGETKKNMAKADIGLKKFSEAEKNLKEDVPLLVKLRNIGMLSETYFLQCVIDTIKKDYKSSLYHYRTHIVYRDSLTNLATKEKIIQQQLSFDYHSKEEKARQEQIKKDLLSNEELHRQKIFTYSVIAFGALLFLFLVILIRAYKEKQKANLIIIEQKAEVEKQKHLNDIKQKEVLDSIHYAKRIQNALMASEKYIERSLNRLIKD